MSGLLLVIHQFRTVPAPQSLNLSVLAFMMGATNMCRECPALLLLRKTYWTMRSKRIPTKKLYSKPMHYFFVRKKVIIPGGDIAGMQERGKGDYLWR